MNLEEEKKEMLQREVQREAEDRPDVPDSEGGIPNTEAASKEGDAANPEAVVSSTAGGGFFDEFSNSNLTSEDDRGRGEDR